MKGILINFFFDKRLVMLVVSVEKSCPEHCLQLVKKEPEKDKTGKEAEVIFEDEISRCMECGIPLFPQSMVKKLKTKIFMTKEPTWSFNLCPSCRIKTQFTPPPIPPPQGERARVRVKKLRA